ncbi:MAG: sigma-70 domain-containing protein [Anaerolineae bacterium]
MIRIRRLYRVARTLEQENGRKPTPEEIAAELNVDPRKVRWMLRVSWQPLSLERPVGEDEDSEFGHFIENEVRAQPVADHLRQDAEREDQRAAGHRHPARSAHPSPALRSAERAQPHAGRSRGDVRAERERIRQIEGRALRRLRQPRRSRHLRDYLSWGPGGIPPHKPAEHRH